MEVGGGGGEGWKKEGEGERLFKHFPHNFLLRKAQDASFRSSSGML